MTALVLRTFQSLLRVAQLQADGVLVGDWAHAHGQPMREAYRAMVAEMARAGVDTDGRPPIWAWRGELTLMDAHMLFAEHELAAGQATIEFAAPAVLAVESDYGAWNDHMAAVLDGVPRRWTVDAPSRSGGPKQVCLPHLRAEWVREIRPLPTENWDDVNMESRA